MIEKSKKGSELKETYEGTVLWFSDTLGYGFIESPDFTKNVYVHYSRIMNNEKFKTLSKGQYVTFSVAETNKGIMAVNIQEKKILKVESTVL